MSPFLNLDDGMVIVDSQVMEDGSAKVYKMCIRDSANTHRCLLGQAP